MGSPGWPPRLSHSSWALEKKKNQFKFNVAFRPHRDHKAYHRRGSQDGHLDFHTAPEIRQANVCHNSRRRYAREVTMFLKGRGISWTLFWFDLKGLAHADLSKKIILAWFFLFFLLFYVRFFCSINFCFGPFEIRQFKTCVLKIAWGSYLTVLSGWSQLPVFTDHARRWTEEHGVGWRSFLTAYWSDAVTGNWYFKQVRVEVDVLTNLLVSVDVKNYWTMLRHWSQLVSPWYVNWHLRTLSIKSSTSSLSWTLSAQVVTLPLTSYWNIKMALSSAHLNRQESVLVETESV